ncbi:MAG: hypothetical protein HY537_04430 [Deltaproteobacteria bacterium]|nr:hypothetical protein [Deltaproteobacteria bacterium]
MALFSGETAVIRLRTFVLVLVYAALSVGYFLQNASYGYTGVDDVFVLAGSWRLFNGQIPYKDALFIRPPIPYFLHSLWFFLPDGWQVLSTRLFFYIEMALSGFLPMLWAVRTNRVHCFTRFLALGIIFFAFAIHSTPAQAWHQIDAIFLASAALTSFLFSLTAKTGSARLGFRISSSLLFCIAAFCKQGFGIFPLMLLTFAGWEKFQLKEDGKKRHGTTLFWCSIVPCFLVAVSIVGCLAWMDGLRAFLHQMSILTIKPLIDSGVRAYLYSPLQIFALAGFVIVFIRYRPTAAPPGNPSFFSKLDLAFFLIVYILVIQANRILIFFPAYALFWLAIGGLLGKSFLSFYLRQPFPLISWCVYVGILSIAWAASISLGYPTPVHGFAALAVLFDDLLPVPFKIKWKNNLASIIIAGLILLSFSLHNYRHYNGGPNRNVPLVNLADVFPRLGPIFTPTEYYEAQKELKQLCVGHAISKGKSFFAIPNDPLIYFLLNQVNTLLLDSAWEIEFLGNEKRFYDQIISKKPILVVEKFPMRPLNRPANLLPHCKDLSDSYRSIEHRHIGNLKAQSFELVTNLVKDWQLIAEGKYFCVFRHPTDF